MGIGRALAIVSCIAALAMATPGRTQTAPAVPSAEDIARALTTPGRGMHMISPAEQPQWSFVGRVSSTGLEPRGGCTGVVVAPDLVLTAAHCASMPGGEPEERAAALQEFMFVAGWNRGGYAHAANIVQSFGHPQARGPRREALGYDLALLRLSEPVPEEIVPLTFGSPPVEDETLVYFGYRAERLHAPALHGPCPLLGRAPRFVVLGCEPRGGNSGSPLLRPTPEGWEIVGLMVAKGDGTGYAALPDAWVLQTIADPPPPPAPAPDPDPAPGPDQTPDATLVTPAQ